jgi:IS4 transposase
MVRLEVHPHRGKYVIYRRVARCRIGPKLKPRTYYVHQESREVHSVGKVQLVFSTTTEPTQGHAVDVQKILMTNDENLSLQDVIELYQLRWQIEMSHPDSPSSDSLYRRSWAA